MSPNAPADLHEQILASLSSGAIAVDRQGVILTSNAAACRQLGLEPDALRPGTRLDGLAGLDAFLLVVDEVMTAHRPVSRREIGLPGEDGDRVVGLSASLLEGPEAFNGAIFLFLDLTDMRRLERAAEVNRQLAQVGELTAGVVHQLRNPLSVISGTAELLLRRLDPGDACRDHIQHILDEACLQAQVIRHFLFQHFLHQTLSPQANDARQHVFLSLQALTQQLTDILTNLLTWWYSFHGVRSSLPFRAVNGSFSLTPLYLTPLVFTGLY